MQLLFCNDDDSGMEEGDCCCAFTISTLPNSTSPIVIENEKDNDAKIKMRIIVIINK